MPAGGPEAPQPAGLRGIPARRARRAGATLAGWFGLAVVWFALLGPADPARLAPSTFLRLPIEGIALVALALAASGRAARTTVAMVVGVALGLVTVLKVVGLAFVEVLDQPFNPVADAAQLGPGLDFVRSSFGPLAGVAAVAAAVLSATAVLVGAPVFVGRLVRLVQARRRGCAVAVLALTALWGAAALGGLEVGPGERVAAADASGFVVSQAQDASAAGRDRRAFDAAVRVDTYADPRAGDLLGLAGKDVVVAFVESYGRIAVEGPASAGVRSLLDADTRRLQASGYGARSAFLTSPTFGGVSWLAHSTLQSGVWVDSQSSYDRLLSGDRTSLTSTFARAGWRTVAFLPSDRGAWPEGRAHYGFDTVYDSSRLGYAGPRFGFSMMPDQFALQAFQRLELGAVSRPPVMAEVDLASSHYPWAPVPSMVAWDGLGDGTGFTRMHDDVETYAGLWTHRDRVPAAYMASIEYSLTALVEFVERYGNDHLVLVLLGDHQPATVVSGPGGNRDVPVTVVARDPRVLDAIAPWGWKEGLRPDASAPVWRMDAFRDRFLDAFSKQSAGPSSPVVAQVQQAP